VAGGGRGSGDRLVKANVVLVRPVLEVVKAEHFRRSSSR
jgi:hypothetical protein